MCIRDREGTVYGSGYAPGTESVAQFEADYEETCLLYTSKTPPRLCRGGVLCAKEGLEVHLGVVEAALEELLHDVRGDVYKRQGRTWATI